MGQKQGWKGGQLKKTRIGRAGLIGIEGDKKGKKEADCQNLDEPLPMNFKGFGFGWGCLIIRITLTSGGG